MATTFDTVVGTGTFTTLSINNSSIWVGLSIVLAVVIGFYVLRSMGLFLLAKRQNIKHAYLAWIPLVWFYILCKLIGKTRLFNMPFEKIAVWLCLIFAVAELLAIAINFILYFPLFQYSLIEGGKIYIGTGEQVGSELILYSTVEGGIGIYVEKKILPFGIPVAKVNNIISVLNTASLFFSLANVIVTISAYFAFFRKYLPQHYMLASLLSIFIPGVFAPFAFACRKKDAIDYNEYIRSRYQQYQNPYQNPYNNPYNQGGYNGGYSQPKQPDHPFSEFAEKGEVDPGDPFDEFSNKKSNDPFEEFDNKN